MLTIAPPVPALAEKLLTIQTSEDVEDILGAFPDAEWRNLGGRENNYPQVNVGSDPGDAWVERITNGGDALIEREVARQGASGLTSPRRAVEVLFGIPNGRLASLDGATRRHLAERLSVTVRESGVRKRPTLVVQDAGIGQHPDAFSRTLLSLNENNKVNRPELMGAFGQGGSSVFAFAAYSAFVSRRDPSLLGPGDSDEVGWTIVRYDPLTDDYKHGVYQYLVLPDGRGGLQIPRFDPSLLPDTHRDFVGCHFVAVEYQLERYADTAFLPSGSMYSLLNQVLFDPVYPILIRDERVKAKKNNERSALNGIVVSGNATRLEEDRRSKVEYSNTSSVLLDDDGAVLVRYYVLRSKGDSKADWELMANYIQHDLAITITRNGQRQGTMRRDIFNRVGLMSIGKTIIGQVNCDGLTKAAKKELFSTTRDRTKQGELAQRLEHRVRNAILGDETLKALDRERKAQALARQSESEAKKINDWLKNAISSLKQGVTPTFEKLTSNNPDYPVLGKQPLLDEAVSKPGAGTSQDEVLLTDPPAVPTTLRVLNPTLRVPAGGAAVVRLAMDAPDDYISPDPGTGLGVFSTTFTKGADLFCLTSYSAVRRGVLTATVAVEKGVPPGENGRAVFLVTRPDGLPLLAEADIETIEPPQQRVREVGKKEGPEPGPNVIGVDREGWLELGQNEVTISRSEDDPSTGITTIYVFKEYPKLMERLRRERVPEEQQVHYQSKFVAAMALATWLQDRDQREADPKADRDVLDAEMRRSAELFLFSEYVATDSAT